MDEIFRRISVRRFQNRTIEVEKTEKLLWAAMAAPSASNQQPWEFYVVASKESLEELASCSPFAGCLKGGSGNRSNGMH